MVQYQRRFKHKARVTRPKMCFNPLVLLASTHGTNRKPELSGSLKVSVSVEVLP